MPKGVQDSIAQVVRGVRLDLAIAIGALLISSVAAGASWWQARVLATQTEVLREQLGATVWPYVSVSEGLNGDTVHITIANDGLGPAILRSATALVDGVPRSSFIDVLHALLGPHLVARAPRGEHMAFTIDEGAPGSVLRPGDHVVGFSLTSKHYAQPFIRGYRRLNFRLCYCAIIPGKCWLTQSSASPEPKPVADCPELTHDLLHASAVDQLTNHNF